MLASRSPSAKASRSAPPRAQEAARPVRLDDRMSAFSSSACRHEWKPMTLDDHCVLNKSSASSRARILVASSAQVRSSSKFRTNCDAWAELLMA